MDIGEMQGRVYFLAGQLEEAKQMLQRAAKELEDAKKKSVNGASETVTADTGTTISL